MQVTQPLPDAALILESILADHADSSGLVLRSGIDLTEKRLMAAGVLLLDGLEVWYELEAQIAPDDPGQVELEFRATGAVPLPPGIRIVIHFGAHHHSAALNEQGVAAWRVPLRSVQDPLTRRVLTPIVIMLGDA